MLNLLLTCPVLRWRPKWQPFTLNATYFDITEIHTDDIGNRMYIILWRSRDVPRVYKSQENPDGDRGRRETSRAAGEGRQIQRTLLSSLFRQVHVPLQPQGPLRRLSIFRL